VKARLDDRIGGAAVTYLLFGDTLGPGLARVPGPGLSHPDRLAMAVPDDRTNIRPVYSHALALQGTGTLLSDLHQLQEHLEDTLDRVVI
jgi:hypothetical protein